MDKANRFLYLNTDSLYSCYSQVFGSLPSEITFVQSQKGKNKELESNKDSDEANGGVGISSNKVEIGTKLELSNSRESEIAIAKENSIRASYHDSIFNTLEGRICNDKNYNSQNGQIGSYVRIKGDIEIVDTDYISNLFDSKYLNKIAQLANDQNGLKLTLEQAKKVIIPMCNIIPYKKFALINGCIMNLDETFIRDDPSIIMFKYSGKMNAFGYITNIIEASDNSDKSNVAGKTNFSGFSAAMNEMILTLLGKHRLKVIHPIGIYY
ncbi:hypothetical protein IJH66_01245 [Candidatus Saccharibacteria bacterium]|nr:hypothetical protein [Candidatus Saccharibacteria bacterium]